jgi:hypothetical protein
MLPPTAPLIASMIRLVMSIGCVFYLAVLGLEEMGNLLIR